MRRGLARDRTVRQIAWVLEEFVSAPAGRNPETDRYRSPHLESTLMADDGLELVDRFQKRFPGRAPDPSMANAQRRVRRLFLRLVTCRRCEVLIEPRVPYLALEQLVCLRCTYGAWVAAGRPGELAMFAIAAGAAL